jgi:hypothetical protein
MASPHLNNKLTTLVPSKLMYLYLVPTTLQGFGHLLGPCKWNSLSQRFHSNQPLRPRGNLGRAGYGATTEGMWPYSYDTCDLGTFPLQQDRNGNPSVQTQLGKDGTFSSLPGQKLSSCSCPGSDHPGPNVGTGRGVPEIDMYVFVCTFTSCWSGALIVKTTALRRR